MSTPEDHIEVEWQFSAPAVGPIAEWLASARVPGYHVTPGAVKDLDDTYYDTDDWRIHAARFTCRTREKKDGAELTLKAFADAKDGMRSRREINERLEVVAPEALAAAPGPGGKLIRAAAGTRPLRPVFSVRTHRQTFLLGDDEGHLGEIALDETSIPREGAEPVRFARVEVEVDAAAVARAQRFVDLLVVTGGLRAVGTSKFEAALEATGQQPTPAVPELGSTAVTDAMPTSEVAFAIMRKHFAVFLANEAGTRIGHDIEALHDMRVAARRLRAAMSAFRPFLSPAIQRIRDELGWVAAALGEVRDLDVQLERIGEWREGFDPGRVHALDAIADLFEARRTAARTRMLRVLDSRRYERFVLRFTAVLRRGPARRFAPGARPILATAPDLLKTRYRRLRKRGDRIVPGTPAAEYHLLRIEAKRLRYCLEFAGPVYGKPATDVSVRLTALQDVLGLHQDADVAVAMLHEMAGRAGRRLGPETVLAMGAISERYRVQAEELRARFPAVYKPLGGSEWRALRRLLESRRPPAP
ncbi:MAG: CHAD domain-containing protein [Chloroflexi bacterium]|nr:CHAD domain-containing protein [Chloroflexota bacterium]